MDDHSIQQESSIEILRAQRAAARRGSSAVQDNIREDQGIDEEDPLISIDDGIRLEPFNMRREMAEGHFDEGGFYILNKDEEKEVTDAWLDTVDQAEKTATFQAGDRQKKAGETTANRLTALSRNLGPDEDEEKEEEEKEGEAAEEEKEDEKAKEASAPDAAEEEAEDPSDEICMLEQLVAELLPLEKPSEALARLASKGGAAARAAGGALRTRKSIKQARAEAANAAPAPSKPTAGARGKRRFSEFGYEDAAPQSSAPPSKAAAQAPSIVTQDTTAQPEPETATPAQDATGEGGASKSSVADAAALAAAAEKAAAKEKAEAEAAAAFAAEMKMTRQSVNLGVDGASGPEVSSIVSAATEEPRTARMAAASKTGGDDEEPDAPMQPRRKRQLEVGADEAERRKKIERLTDLCDRLLQRGVLVYESPRELLAIEVRERKGEQLRPEEGQEEAESGASKSTEPAAETAKKTPTASEEKGQVLFENRRYQPPGGDAAGVEAPQTEAAPAGPEPLLWQFRWAATPEEIHGPFDSVTMQGWVTQGCFAQERPAEVRQCDRSNKGLEGCWHTWSNINFSLYL